MTIYVLAVIEVIIIIKLKTVELKLGVGLSLLISYLAYII
jgi:hypothetical protein